MFLLGARAQEAQLQVEVEQRNLGERIQLNLKAQLAQKQQDLIYSSFHLILASPGLKSWLEEGSTGGFQMFILLSLGSYGRKCSHAQGCGFCFKTKNAKHSGKF